MQVSNHKSHTGNHETDLQLKSNHGIWNSTSWYFCKTVKVLFIGKAAIIYEPTSQCQRLFQSGTKWNCSTIEYEPPACLMQEQPQIPYITYPMGYVIAIKKNVHG